jgi:hypothetical protein
MMSVRISSVSLSTGLPSTHHFFLEPGAIAVRGDEERPICAHQGTERLEIDPDNGGREGREDLPNAWCAISEAESGGESVSCHQRARVWVWEVRSSEMEFLFVAH